jgi:hypothetical protein
VDGRAKPGQDASTSGPPSTVLVGPTGIALRVGSLLDKIRSVRYVITLIGISFRSAPGPQAGKEKVRLVEASLDCNPPREPKARQIFLAFFGCNPLKSPDSEN